MMMIGTQIRRTATSMFLCLALLVVPGVPAVAHDPGDGDGKPTQGCTPGFWKNHIDLWTGFAPGQTVGSVFTIPGSLSSLAGFSLLDALSFGGGSGTLGGARTLLREGVAALLNAASPDVNYAFGDSTAAVIAFVNGGLASGSRGEMLARASQLDTFNNLGCPLN